MCAKYLQGASIYLSKIFIPRGAPDTLDEKDCGTESDDNDDDILFGSQPKGTGTQGTTRCVAEECDSQVSPGALQDLDELIEDFDDED